MSHSLTCSFPAHLRIVKSLVIRLRMVSDLCPIRPPRCLLRSIARSGVLSRRAFQVMAELNRPVRLSQPAPIALPRNPSPHNSMPSQHGMPGSRPALEHTHTRDRTHSHMRAHCDTRASKLSPISFCLFLESRMPPPRLSFLPSSSPGISDHKDPFQRRSA